VSDSAAPFHWRAIQRQLAVKGAPILFRVPKLAEKGAPILFRVQGEKRGRGLGVGGRRSRELTCKCNSKGRCWH
jgi:hypothetical protein